jgi:hypothetical protein
MPCSYLSRIKLKSCLVGSIFRQPDYIARHHGAFFYYFRVAKAKGNKMESYKIRQNAFGILQVYYSPVAIPLIVV